MDKALALLGLNGRIGWGNKFAGNSAGHIFIPERAERCKHLKITALNLLFLHEIGKGSLVGRLGGRADGGRLCWRLLPEPLMEYRSSRGLRIIHSHLKRPKRGGAELSR